MDLGTIAFWLLMAIFGGVGLVGLWIGSVLGLGYMYQHQYDPPMSVEQKRSWWIWSGVVVLTVLVGVGRFTIPTRHDIPTWNLSYEALAHILVGMLIGAGLTTRSWSYWWLLIILTGLEVAAFLLF